MPDRSTPIIRSLLFIPGNQPNMLQKGLGVNADALVPDLEDSVPADEKANARKVTASFLPTLAEAGRMLIPRVNSLDTDLLEEDLAAVVGPHIFGVSVGKIQDSNDIETICGILDGLEQKAGLKRGSVRLLPWIETAKAMVDVYRIGTASPRILGLAFGAEDFTHDMGIERSDDGAEVEHAGNTLCIAARAAEVPAFDTPYFKFRDPDGLRLNTNVSKRRGFKGKFAIHPAQIDTINEVFSPSPAEIDHARRVVVAFEEAERQGRGSTSLDDKVIDVPVVKRARALLQTAAEIANRPKP